VHQGPRDGFISMANFVADVGCCCTPLRLHRSWAPTTKDLEKDTTCKANKFLLPVTRPQSLEPSSSWPGLYNPFPIFNGQPSFRSPTNPSSVYSFKFQPNPTTSETRDHRNLTLLSSKNHASHPFHHPSNFTPVSK
jgi:hypothetical protein